MKKELKLFLLLLIPLNLAGQLSSVTSHYVFNPLIINPACAGNRGALNVAAIYRSQWTGIDGAPKTMTLMADAPFSDSKLGLGFIILNDKIGVTKQTHFVTNYAYKIAMGEDKLSLGFGAGLITTNTSWSDLVALDPGDDKYLTDSRVYVVPDFSFGAYYSSKAYYIGLSIPKLIGYKFNTDKNKYDISFKPGENGYMLNAGLTYKLSRMVRLLPSALVTLSTEEKLLVDLNAYVNYDDMIWAGLSYRNKRSIGALFQFAVNNQFRVAYTYDFDFGTLSKYSNGSHEIMLRYEFRYKVNAISPLNF